VNGSMNEKVLVLLIIVLREVNDFNKYEESLMRRYVNHSINREI
jgi:hypothetical protein